MAEAPSEATAPGLDPIIKEMHDQNDRGAAIAGGAFLEEKLQTFIELRWPPISNTMRSRLFTGYGPLSSFSAKIVIARAMGVLNVASRADFDKIRLIRNDAAHLGTPFSFNNPAVRKRLDAIHCIRHFGVDERRSDPHTRNQFTSAVKILATYLWFQDRWKEKFGFKEVMPDFDNTRAKDA